MINMVSFRMIIGSLYITGGAIVVGVPIGIFTAVFLAKYCPEGLYKIMKPATELLAESLLSYMDSLD